MPTRWSVLRAAQYGAFCGLAYSVFNAFPFSGAGPEYWTFVAGGLFGGAVAGGFMFAAVATIRNLFVR